VPHSRIIGVSQSIVTTSGHAEMRVLRRLADLRTDLDDMHVSASLSDVRANRPYSAFCNCLHHVQNVCLSHNATGTTHFTGDAGYWSRGGLGAHHAEIDFAEQLIADHGLSFADRA
jgi:hypothetical protein